MQCTAWRQRFTPYQSKDPNPTIPANGNDEEKRKTVEDKKGASSLGQHWPCIGPALKSIGPSLETRQSHTIEYVVCTIVPQRH